jgi:hypothetical protein
MALTFHPSGLFAFGGSKPIKSINQIDQHAAMVHTRNNEPYYRFVIPLKNGSTSITLTKWNLGSFITAKQDDQHNKQQKVGPVRG